MNTSGGKTEIGGSSVTRDRTCLLDLSRRLMISWIAGSILNQTDRCGGYSKQ